MVEILFGITLIIASTLSFLYLVDRINISNQDDGQNPDPKTSSNKAPKAKIHSIPQVPDFVSSIPGYASKARALAISVIKHPVTIRLRTASLNSLKYLTKKLPVLGDKLLESLRPIKEDQEVKDKLNSLSRPDFNTATKSQDSRSRQNSDLSDFGDESQANSSSKTQSQALPNFIARDEDKLTDGSASDTSTPAKKSRPRASAPIKQINHAITISDDHEDEDTAVLSAIKKIKNDTQTATQNSKSNSVSQEAEGPLIKAFEKSRGGQKLEHAIALGDLYGQLNREDDQREMYLWVIKKSAPQHESIKQIAAQKLIAMR